MSVLFLTLTPGAFIPIVPSWMDLLSWDKIIHLILFGTQAILLARLFEHRTQKRIQAALLGALFGTVFGALIEVLQANLPIGRSGNVYDLVADFVGSVFGMLIFLRMTRFDEQRA